MWTLEEADKLTTQTMLVNEASVHLRRRRSAQAVTPSESIRGSTTVESLVLLLAVLLLVGGATWTFSRALNAKILLMANVISELNGGGIEGMVSGQPPPDTQSDDNPADENYSGEEDDAPQGEGHGATDGGADDSGGGGSSGGDNGSAGGWTTGGDDY